MKIKRRLFSGYSESDSKGVSYINSQVIPTLNTVHDIVPGPKAKRTIEGVKGTLELSGLASEYRPSEEDYIKAHALRDAVKGLEYGEKTGKIIGSDSSNFPVKIISLIGSGIGSGVGAIRGYIKYKKKNKRGKD